VYIFPFQFKEIPKLGGVDSSFYRQNLGLTSYPGFSPGLLHPSLGGSTPFAPPNHLPTFISKVYRINIQRSALRSVLYVSTVQFATTSWFRSYDFFLIV
jgi:hypothetical protein